MIVTHFPMETSETVTIITNGPGRGAGGGLDSLKIHLVMKDLPTLPSLCAYPC